MPSARALLCALALALLVPVGAAVPAAHAQEPGAAAPAVPEGTVAGWPAYRLPAETSVLGPQPPERTFRALVRLVVDGRPRSFSVLVPAGLPTPAPLVLGLHGLYQTREGTDAQMSLLREAVTRRFIAVYPAGTDASWNAGRCCGRAAATRVDDVAALERVVAAVHGAHPVDPARTYAVGYSNGGMMAYKAACESPRLLAAIAVVAGAYVTASTCTPTQPIPTLVVHGARDGVVPYAGTRSSAFLRTSLPSVAQSVAVVKRVNAPAGVPTRLDVLPRGGHGWPTLAKDRYDATRAALDFVLRARRPLTAAPAR